MISRYDVVIAGGGLAGSALGGALARKGVRTLIVERERRFRDRVRGEQLQPWGVAEAARLGVLDVLRHTCGHDQRYFEISIGGASIGKRDLPATTPHGMPGLNFYHPDMQETLLYEAAGAGAEVRRGAAVREIRRNGLTQVTIEEEGRIDELRARFVVGADGLHSAVRRSALFETKHDPPFLLIAGVLVDGIRTDPESAVVAIDPSRSQTTAIFPQGEGRARVYAMYPESAGFRLQGERDLPRFVEEATKAGLAREVFSGIRFSGPLASFDTADAWVEGPYADGVALIGDAAAASNPAWGQGLALGLLDARLLSEALLGIDDWDDAGRAYASAHDRRYRVIHEVTSALTDLFLRSGPEAEARRARALPKIAADPTRVPDHGFGGPELPWNAEIRARFFGEDGGNRMT